MKKFECKKCGFVIPENTHGIYKSCKCGKISVKSTHFNYHLIGDPKYLRILKISEKKPLKVYRIKQVSTGLYYKPLSHRSPSHFTENGKFYVKRPSMKWVENLGECVIETYEVSLSN